jgi:hypothetical protein
MSKVHTHAIRKGDIMTRLLELIAFPRNHVSNEILDKIRQEEIRMAQGEVIKPMRKMLVEQNRQLQQQPHDTWDDRSSVRTADDTIHSVVAAKPSVHPEEKEEEDATEEDSEEETEEETEEEDEPQVAEREEDDEEEDEEDEEEVKQKTVKAAATRASRRPVSKPFGRRERVVSNHHSPASSSRTSSVVAAAPAPRPQNRQEYARSIFQQIQQRGQVASQHQPPVNPVAYAPVTDVTPRMSPERMEELKKWEQKVALQEQENLQTCYGWIEALSVLVQTGTRVFDLDFFHDDLSEDIKKALETGRFDSGIRQLITEDAQNLLRNPAANIATTLVAILINSNKKRHLAKHQPSYIPRRRTRKVVPPRDHDSDGEQTSVHEDHQAAYRARYEDRSEPATPTPRSRQKVSSIERRLNRQEQQLQEIHHTLQQFMRRLPEAKGREDDVSSEDSFAPHSQHTLPQNTASSSMDRMMSAGSSALPALLQQQHELQQNKAALEEKQRVLSDALTETHALPF